MTMLHIPDGVNALIPTLDASLAECVRGRADDGVAIADVVRGLRRAGWSPEWAIVFVRDRLDRIADAYDGLLEPAMVERARVIIAIECLRVVVNEPEAPPVVAEEPAPSPGAAPPVAPPRRDCDDPGPVTRPVMPRRERPAASVPHRASGRQLQIRMSPSRPRR